MNRSYIKNITISDAIEVIEDIKIKPDYVNLRITHGKDRCANQPRSGPWAGGVEGTASGNAAVIVNDGTDGDHTRENGLGLAPNVRTRMLSASKMEARGSPTRTLRLIRKWCSLCNFDENLFGCFVLSTLISHLCHPLPFPASVSFIKPSTHSLRSPSLLFKFTWPLPYMIDFLPTRFLPSNLLLLRCLLLVISCPYGSLTLSHPPTTHLLSLMPTLITCG